MYSSGSSVSCRHKVSMFQYRRLTPISIEYICPKCDKSIGIIVDPRPGALDHLIELSPYGKVEGTVRKMSTKERRGLR